MGVRDAGGCGAGEALCGKTVARGGENVSALVVALQLRGKTGLSVVGLTLDKKLDGGMAF